MKKNMWKMILDIVMILILVLLYNSHVANLIFHELTGLIVCGLFIVHCFLNRKWLIGISRKFFTASLPFKTRFGYVINLFLLITFTMLIVSGINTSQVLFPANATGGIWRGLHHQAGAISILLVGIHLGLHWGFILHMAKKTFPLSAKIALKISPLLVVAIVLFGSYHLATGSFKNWLSEPFVTQTKTEQPVTHDSSGSSEIHTAKEGEHKTGGDFKVVDTTPFLVLNTITTYLSMIGVFTIVTYYSEKLFGNTSRRTILR